MITQREINAFREGLERNKEFRRKSREIYYDRLKSLDAINELYKSQPKQLNQHNNGTK